jgi:hypothetical protein
MSIFQENYCFIGFVAHAGAGLASDAPLAGLADAGIQACGALTDAPPGIKLAVFPVHFAWQAFMSLFDIFSLPQAAVMASGESEAKDATPTGCALVDAAIPLQAEEHGAIAHSFGKGVQFFAGLQVWAVRPVIPKPVAKKKIINTFFMTNRFSE